MRFRVFLLVVTSFLLLSSGSQLRAQTTPTITIPLTIVDASGYSRSNDPVTSGVPIPLSAVNDSWSLLDGSTEIPLQTTILPGRATPWLLVDFPATVGSLQAKNYTLRNVAPSTPATGLSYVSTGSSETITTGPVKLTIGTNPFLGVQDLWYDDNGNGVFEVSEHRISTGRADALRVTNAETSVTTSATPTPTAVSWEDQGTQRGTLRIDGTFVESSATLIKYTLRLTVWAGRSDLGVELILKNSQPSAAKLVKLSSAVFQIGTSATTARPNRTGDRAWGLADANGATLQFLPVNEEVSTAYDPNSTPRIERVTTTFNVDSNGGLVIGDLSYQGGNVTVDFNTALAPLDQASATNRTATPLFARASSSWYSDHNAFGLPGFGSLSDEQTAYTAWNWTWPNPNNAFAVVPHINRPTNFYPSWSNTNAFEDPESDFVSQNAVMYIRLGDQGFKDRLDAFARYATNQWIFRTDGFTAYDNGYWDGPHQVNRGTDTLSNPTATDLNRINKDIAFGRVDYSHAWGGGLVDYYYLTGNREALGSAIDIAEECRNQTDWLEAGTDEGSVGDSPRAKARCWQTTLRVVEATNDAQWITANAHYRDLFLNSTRYSTAHLYTSDTCNIDAAYCTRYPNGKFLSSFQIGDMVHAMYLDWTLFGNTALRTRLLEIADFAKVNSTDPATNATGDYIVFVGSNIYHHSYSVFRGTTPTTIYNYAGSSYSFIDSLAIGYRLSNDRSYLGKAKQLYGAATKRLAIDPYSQTIADASHVGMFAGYLFGNANQKYNDDMSYIALFLKDAYLADDTAPGQTLNLGTN